MSIDHQTLDHLARLSRLALDDAERERFGLDLNRTLAMIDRLHAIDVQNVAVLSHPHEPALPLREDVVEGVDLSQALLALAPEAQGGYFLVPKVIE